MESVAWVETLGSRGHVLNRQPVFKWPVRISHSYDCDVVVDGRGFPDLMVDLSSDEVEKPVIVLRIDGQKQPANQLVPLRLNGRALTFDGTGSVAIGGDDVFQCGATRIRVRLRGHAVSDVHADEKVFWHSSWAAAIIVLGAWFAFLAYFGFANSLEEDVAAHFDGPSTALLFLLIWWGFWSSISRVATGMFYAREHLLIGGLLVAAFVSMRHIGSIAAFATGLGSLASVGKLLQLVMVGLAIHAHLLLVKPAKPLVSVLRASLVPALLWLFVFDGVSTIYPPEQRPMAYDASIWPSSFVISQGDSEENFLNGLDAAKEKVDDAAKLIASRR